MSRRSPPTATILALMSLLTLSLTACKRDPAAAAAAITDTASAPSGGPDQAEPVSSADPAGTPVGVGSDAPPTADAAPPTPVPDPAAVQPSPAPITDDPGTPAAAPVALDLTPEAEPQDDTQDEPPALGEMSGPDDLSPDQTATTPEEAPDVMTDPSVELAPRNPATSNPASAWPVPVTAVPVTAAPVTAVPVAAAPVTAVPVTAAPGTPIQSPPITPPTAPPVSSGPSTATGKTIWYLPAPNGDVESASMNAAKVALVNSLPFDGVGLLLSGISWKILTPGYTLDYQACMTQTGLDAGITKKKAVIILTNYPAPPSDTGAWAKTNSNFGVLARCLKDSGWVGLFHDPEAYVDQNNNPLPGPWASWPTLNRDPAGLADWAARYGEQAKIISDNYPGMVYGWYHSAAVGDGKSQDVTQGGNEFLPVGAAYAGMVDAVAAGAARLNLIDMGEKYDAAGASFFAGNRAYRSNEVQNNLTTLSSAGQAAWSRLMEIGFMRMTGYSTTTSASNVAQELRDLWPNMTANGIAGYYDESSFAKMPPFLTEGIKAFIDNGRQ